MAGRKWYDGEELESNSIVGYLAENYYQYGYGNDNDNDNEDETDGADEED